MIAVLLGGGLTSTASADETLATVTVHAQDGSVSAPQPVTVSELANCPPYGQDEMDERTAGGSTVAVTFDGSSTWTIPTILRCGLADAADPQRVVVGRDSGPELGAGAVLDAADLGVPQSDFADPAESPVIFDRGSSVEYDRPSRPGDDADFSDEIVQNDPIALEVWEGANPLTVAITPSAATVPAGTPVTLASTVSGSAGTVSYDWQFPSSGVENATGADPTVTFPAAGTYPVDLEASDQQGDGGAATTTITVTSSAPAPTPTTGTSAPGAGTNPTSTAAPTGPARGRSGHRPAAGTTTRTTARTGTAPSPTTTRPAGPTTGGGTTTSRGAPSSSTTTATTTATTSRTSTTTTSTTTSTATATATTGAAAAPPPTTSTSEPAPPATSPPTAPRPRPRAKPHPTHRTTSRHRTGRGRLVSGRLIGDISLLPAGSSPLVRPTASPAPAAAAPVSARRAGAASPWPWVAAGVIVAGLLLAGATRERRGGRGLRLRP